MSALTGVLATLAAVWLIQNIETVFASAHVWAICAIIPLAGITFFWVRAHYRLVYGVTEFGVGLAAALMVFWPSFVVSAFGLAIVLQLLGRLYIMLRGLDNVGKGLKGTSLGVRWQRWFPD